MTTLDEEVPRTLETILADAPCQLSDAELERAKLAIIEQSKGLPLPRQVAAVQPYVEERHRRALLRMFYDSR